LDRPMPAPMMSGTMTAPAYIARTCWSPRDSDFVLDICIGILLFLNKFDFACFEVCDTGERFYMVAFLPEFTSAFLECFFNDDSDTGDFSTCLVCEMDQRFGGLAVGEEIVDDEHRIILPEEFMGHTDFVGLLLCVGVYFGSEQSVCQSEGLSFACKYDRHIHQQPGHHRRGDAGGFKCQYFRDASTFETALELLSDFMHQLRIDLMVQTIVDLEHRFGKGNPFR